jgi:hypothetical protein
MRNGTKVVVCVGEATSYGGVISGNRMNAAREWEIQSDGVGLRWVPESEISFPADFDHGSHSNKTVNGFGTGGFENTADIAICDQLPGVMHKDGAKSFHSSAYFLNLPPVKAYYLARQKILLSQLKHPPTVWIGGEDVLEYMHEFFDHRPVVQTGGGVVSYGLSEYVLKKNIMRRHCSV